MRSSPAAAEEGSVQAAASRALESLAARSRGEGDLPVREIAGRRFTLSQGFWIDGESLRQSRSPVREALEDSPQIRSLREAFPRLRLNAEPAVGTILFWQGVNWAVAGAPEESP